jgi:iron complex transport system ATP-binding protein
MMLQVQGICVAFAGREVLKDVSFDVQAGEILGVIGPNGAGKTTLIRALSGVVAPSRGEVRIDGRNLGSLKPAERARRVAVVPQARSLPQAFTGWELVLLGRTPHLNWLGSVTRADEEGVIQALELARASDLAHRRLGELSGGEQQRLLLARALAQQAPLLLLDEPTTHLDLQYQVQLLDEVRSLAQNRRLAVVVALHDLNLVSRYADRVALLVDGSLRALGAPADVLQPDLLGQVYQIPLQIVEGTASGRPVILPRIL